MRHQEIILGVLGQRFAFDPPEMFRPTGTPTLEVFSTDEDDDGEMESAAGACSVDSVDTEIASSASSGSVSLTVASGTGIARGRRYLITADNGECEFVECSGISGAAVTIRHPLINAYDAGATFQGTRISASVDAAWVADDNNLTDALSTEIEDASSAAPGAAGYRLRWVYTVNGDVSVAATYADLVRYSAKNLVSPLDVDRLFPGWIDRLPTDYRADQGAAFIEEAFQAMRMDALTDAQLVRRIRDTQVLAELVKYRANVLSAQSNVMQYGASIDVLNVARDLYAQRYNALIREPKIAVDQGGGGANGEAIRLPVFRR